MFQYVAMAQDVHHTGRREENRREQTKVGIHNVLSPIIAMDADGDGSVSASEFEFAVCALLGGRAPSHRRLARLMFAKLRTNAAGCLEEPELLNAVAAYGRSFRITGEHDEAGVALAMCIRAMRVRWVREIPESLA